MTADVAKAQRKRYLQEIAQIRAFPAAPENLELLRMQESVVDGFQFKIIAKRKDQPTFDAVIAYLADLLFNRDPVLRQHAHRRLTRAVLFTMYWNCEIGSVGDAGAGQALSSGSHAHRRFDAAAGTPAADA